MIKKLKEVKVAHTLTYRSFKLEINRVKVALMRQVRISGDDIPLS